MPLCFGTSASVRARQIPQRANCAYDVHTFWPESSQPSSTRTARVASDARSEPASGSLNSWHQISSAVRIAGSQRCFCSSVPCASSVGPARLIPTRLIGWSARDRAYSMLKIATCTGDAPRPPYSSGQWMPTQRAAASSACHVRPNSTSSAMVSKRSGTSTCAASHARTSCANAASSGVNERSTCATDWCECPNLTCGCQSSTAESRSAEVRSALMSVDLAGAADLHCHFGPDPHRERSVDAFEAAARSRGRGPPGRSC